MEKELDFKPGYSLVKYGDVLSLNFNQDFAKRVTNVLVDHVKNDPASKDLVYLAKQLRYLMAEEENASVGVQDEGESDQFIMFRMEHVYSVILKKDLALKIHSLFSGLLNEHRVSPALFSFAKQLQGYLFPKRHKDGFADDY